MQIQLLLQKLHVENFPRNPKKIDKISMSVFPRLLFYVLSRFQVLLCDGKEKKTTKSSKINSFLIFRCHIFGRFSVRGVKKYDIKNKSDQPW
jgi:hypothetical protein